MNLDELQTVWDSPANQPNVRAVEVLRNQFLVRMQRQRRFQAIWLAWTYLALTAVTLFAGWQVFVAAKVSLWHEWGLVLLLGVPWAFAIHFLKRFRAQPRSRIRSDVPIVTVFRAALAENRATRHRLKVVAVLYVILIPVLALVMWQLSEVGKASAQELMSMAILFGSILSLSAAGVAARYFARLVPQGRHLEDLLRQYDQNPVK